ncbi:hypothetical protein NST61_05520 [Caldifermentibacillus hisashii]|uniref:hypothetical protein n=1 Tax=Caldifermentibacillus hisashii TaxID=996558 RepID=UPI0034D4E914
MATRIKLVTILRRKTPYFGDEKSTLLLDRAPQVTQLTNFEVKVRHITTNFPHHYKNSKSPVI